MDGLDEDKRFVRALADRTGLTPTAIAKHARLATTTITRPFYGTATTRMSARTIEKLREAFPNFFRSSETSHGMLSLTSSRHLAGTHLDEESHAIPILELTNQKRFSSADGRREMRFPQSFLEMITNAPAEHLAFAHAIGDSMTPTADGRDLLLIDKSQKIIRVNDQIWCLSSDGVCMVKRVRIQSTGRAVLISDNPAVPDLCTNLEQLTLVGRVIAIVKSA